MDGVQEVVEVTHADGGKERWTTDPRVSLSAKSIKHFMEICIVPKPISVEIVETATPELPYPPQDR